MSACIFLGPTLALADARRALDAIYLPPAGQGDVHRAVSLLRPRAIGIVDGYFRSVPSVWHKEILWALDRGVHVLGAASMGALRAAELAPFGMHGVGRIFAGYRAGAFEGEDEPFEDDDEVAIAHAPAQLGYAALSEAMINIRCTLAQAQARGVVSPATRKALADIAKRMFFPERSYEALLERARAAGLPAVELDALQAWIPGGRVDQKREDALLLLTAIRDFLATDPAPVRPAFVFEHTTLWERSIAESAPSSIHARDEALVLEELRLDAPRWAGLRDDTLRALGRGIDDADIASRLALGIAGSHGEPHDIERAIDEAARADALRGAFAEIPRALLERHLLARLRASGEFARLKARGEDKARRLGARAGLPQAEEFSELELLELRDWYFAQALGGEMPDDIEAWVRDAGYRDLADFHRAIFAENVYRRLLVREGGAVASAPAGAAPEPAP